MGESYVRDQEKSRRHKPSLPSARYLGVALIIVAVVSTSFVALQPAAKEFNLGDSGHDFEKPSYTKPIDYYVTTPFYRVGLKYGIIHSFSIGNIPDLLNYSSWYKIGYPGQDLGEKYGLGLNEIAFTGAPGGIATDYVMQYSFQTTYEFREYNGKLRVEAMSTTTNAWNGISFNNTFIFSNSTPVIEVFTTRIFDTSKLPSWAAYSASHQICFIFPVQSVTAYFDAGGSVSAPANDTWYLRRTVFSSGYQLYGGSYKFRINILEVNQPFDFHVSIGQRTLGLDYSEIEITFFGLGASSGALAFNGILTEFVHYSFSVEA